MRFNRAIGKIKVLSFDLDDTLYDNHPIIASALRAQADYLRQLPCWPHQDNRFWMACRNQALKENPDLLHDVTLWRQRALYLGLLECGLTHEDALEHAQNAYAAFAQARSQISVCPSVIKLLNDLKQRYTLIAITNGNADVEQFNLAGMFSLVLQAGKDGRSKPFRDLFDNAVNQLNILPTQLLHIGDSLDTDVQGANNAHCRSVWLNNQNCTYRYQGLADIEISDIKQLQYF
ncbi:HAD-IA family hydrolase [Pseudoalteromonas sp. JBTF-M23]|uniref:HAD-IA family hydrolase n=1 Tax=Pseudoalteromonas caenipelagi TaxID=2726988 RepID=A0A849VJK0_9GAMM|nr:HAD-IA family hydrolase [Pseudoalteromonas caenipelagi]NOU52990.1 HAD-IA family hydrolase [Pseudoalteromonas caenipelagi]